MTEQASNIDEFLRGQIDCKAGVDHKAGQPEFYDRGYSYQYFVEQAQSERALRAEMRAGK